MTETERRQRTIDPDETTQYALDAPLILSLSHEELGEEEMFRLAFLIDAMELRGDPMNPGRRLGESVVFDLLELEPTRTSIRVGPRRSLTYDQFHHYLGYLLERVRTSMGRSVRLQRLAWELREHLGGSDLRGGNERGR